MTPAVSIIIPVYNTEKYLRECLDSILNQSLTDIEVLCVNDGSTDSSLEILNEYAAKDSRVVVINSETNNGLAYARDLGLRQMTGKWVKFVDSDDLLPKGTLERQVKTAEANNADILVHAAESFYESKEMAENFRKYESYYIFHEEYPSVLSGPDYLQQTYDNKDYHPSACIRLYRAEFLVKNDLSFKKGLFSSEDELFTMLATLYADRVSLMKEVGYLRRVREGSTMTAPVNIRYLRSRFIVCGALRDELSKVPANRLRPAVGEQVHSLERSLPNLAAELREQGFTLETYYDRYMFETIEYCDKEIQTIMNSPSVKIGRAITAPLRKIRDLLRKE